MSKLSSSGKVRLRLSETFDFQIRPQDIAPDVQTTKRRRTLEEIGYKPAFALFVSSWFVQIFVVSIWPIY
jgi:hypothetical protein